MKQYIKNLFVVTLISSLGSLALVACGGSSGGGEGAQSVAPKKESPVLVPASSKLKNLDFFGEGACPSKDLFEKPRFSSDQKKLEESGVEFLASNEAMKVLIDEYGYSFSDIQVFGLSKYSTQSLFRHTIAIDKDVVSKICIRTVEAGPLFTRKGEAKKKVVEVNMMGPKIAQGQQRLLITGPTSYRRLYVDGRKTGRYTWYNFKSVEDVKAAVPAKQYQLGHRLAKAKEYLKMMSFDLSDADLKKYFDGFDYHLTSSWFRGSKQGMNFENGIVISTANFESLLFAAADRGANAFEAIDKKKYFLDAVLVARLMQMHSGFSGVRAYMKADEYPEYPKLPTFGHDSEKWHFWYFMLDLNPQLEVHLLNECHDKFKDAHEELYCKLLKDQMAVEKKDWDKFVAEKYSARRSQARLDEYISLDGRRIVLKKFMEMSNKILTDLWPLKRENIATDIARSKEALAKAKAMPGQVDALQKLTLGIMKMAGAFGSLTVDQEIDMMAAQVLADELSIAQFESKVLQMYDRRTEGEDFVKIYGDDVLEYAHGRLAERKRIYEGSEAQMLEWIQAFEESASKENPFDNPFAHLK